MVVSLGGAPVRDTSDVLAALGPDTVGKPLAARVVRAGALRDLTLTVGERPRGGR